MDWSNEHYVRIYTRDTTTWLRLGWDGQCVLMQMARKMDLAGVMDIDDLEPWEAVVMHCRAEETVAKRGMAANLRLGVLEHRGGHLLMPNYIEAQEASKSDKQRQREARDRRRARAKRTNVSQNVTTDTDSVTEASQPVTAGHSRSLVTSAVQCVTDADASRARPREDLVVDREESKGSQSHGGGGADRDGPSPAAVSKVWNAHAQACGSGGHALAHHRDDFGILAGLCGRLEGGDWRDLIGWYWSSGWGGQKPHLAKPRSLCRAWDASVAEWRDPEGFRASRETAGGKRQKTHAELMAEEPIRDR